MRIASIVGRILLILTPLLFVIGIFRIIIVGSDSFLPSGSEIIDSFYSMPNFMKVLTTSIFNLKESLNNVSISFESIHSIDSFFSFVSSIGSLLTALVTNLIDTVVGAVDYLIWVFELLFGF